MSATKSRSSLLLMIVLVVAGIAVALYLSGLNQPDVPLPALNKILYNCDDNLPDSNLGICIINTDGNEKRELVLDARNAALTRNPWLNKLGQIVYDCEPISSNGGPFTRDICAIKADGSGSTRFSPPMPLSADLLLKINNKGQVLFDCGGICYTEIRPDQTFNGTITQIALPPGLVRRTNYPLGFNDKGLGLFTCFDNRSPENMIYQYNLCVFSLEEMSVKELLVATEETDYISGAINNSGVIVYNCGGTTLSDNICSINFDGTDQKMLAQTQVQGLAIIKDMNERGQIVFDCTEGGLPWHICVMSLTDRNFRQITNGQENENAPSINEDGVIAYACGNNLCVINFDGTGQRQLTNNESPFGIGNPIIR